MSSTSVSVSNASVTDLDDIYRQIRSFHIFDNARNQLAERLVQRLVQLDSALQTARASHETQIFERRQWEKRAKVAESSLESNRSSQFALVLIDGDHSTFMDVYLKDVDTGGSDAARDLSAQIQAYITGQKIHEGPTALPLMIYIFADKRALSQRLLDLGTISDLHRFDEFIAQFMRAQSFLYFVDCGPGAGAVENKIRESYEFHFENHHCKHLFLGLKQESGYIEELDKFYGDDPSTLARTSLLTPSHAVSSKFAFAFRVVDTPALSTLALISFDFAEGPCPERKVERNRARLTAEKTGMHHGLQGLFDTDHDAKSDSNITKNSKDSSAESPAGQADSSTTSSINATHPVQDEQGFHTQSAIPTKLTPAPQNSQTYQRPKSLHKPAPPPLQKQKSRPAVAKMHSSMDDWETAPAQDAYTPAPDMRPWGSEPVPSLDASPTVNDNSHIKHFSAPHPPETPKPNSSQETGAWESNIDTHPSLRPTAGQFAVHDNREVYADPIESKRSSPMTKSTLPTSASSVVVAVNRHGQRIDLPLPHPSANDMSRFKSRSRRRNLCNFHHLRGNCETVDCQYDHDPIDQTERLCLQIVVRNIACRTGPRCRRFDCYLGHHCPHKNTSTGCKNHACPFQAKGMHKINDLVVDTFITQ